MSDVYDPELDLLGDDAQQDASAGPAHAFRTAPVFTGDAAGLLGSDVLPQRALYGRVLSQKAPGFPATPVSPKLYTNTNAPFSALVCGLQGSGKSHSTSVFLEGCLITDPRLGTLPEPLSALVFHYDTAAGGGAVQPCEAAYLSCLDATRGGQATPPEVIVLVLPANLQAMKQVYAGLPAVRVEPLRFSAEDISGERLLAMMKVDENTQMPLYMEAIMSILRSMENKFNYNDFRSQLKQQKLNPSQKAMLNLRLSLLDSCLEGGNKVNRVATHFRKGQLTIVDLSSPFMDASSACGFFDLILGLFVEADVNAAGKLVVLDEAHKYLSDTQTGTSARLTESLLSVIRQQRHLATRVVISTQEPTVVPSKFLDLCSFIIAHRFSSPKWLRLLTDHISIAGEGFDELFSKIVSLRTGQAIMFAPNGLGARGVVDGTSSRSDTGDSGISLSEDMGTVMPFGQGYLLVQSRLRVTRDGGHSILAVPDPASTTRVQRSAKAAEDTVPDEAVWGAPSSSVADWSVPEPAAPSAAPAMASGWKASGSSARQASTSWVPPTAQYRQSGSRGRGRKSQWAKSPRPAAAPQPARASAQASNTSGWSGGWGTSNTTSSWGAPASNTANGWGEPAVDDAWGVDPAASAEPEKADGWSTAADDGGRGTEPAPPANEKSKFAPLIEYLSDKKKMGLTGVTVSSIEDWFGADIISEAVSKDLVQRVATAKKPKITLAPGVQPSDFTS
ncbi:uncharacterized protein PHACADRAFT_209647 [Phanerochaete carnosa HHB-10118-sp]|uniref:Zona occludens toxin N-terminal domain-containing protein n=1 Tax=Phanerochaete carnosa (strain HHB-10118-sp) TaxID=650164 RepID=K5WAZ3_PHACS|nr:uncharacterized protein PHACADRAFT_209647 [Phanerochaete carnosa HHB-10118-sp]EKM56159.1 hypothetical protein PHACADRAFT_209647 [Phanerochaete carnosa HHB-10118-sp]